jgi:hypothetical protein
MVRGHVRVAAIAAGLCLAATSALAQPAGVTKDEVKCESGTGKALTKFVGAKSKCAQKCFKAARKTTGPYDGCFPPYTDPTINTCILDPTKGAEAKARGAIVKACAKDCPECYGPATCSSGEPFVTNTENLIDLQGPSVYCTEDGGNTPTKGEAKCEDGNAKALVKFVGAKSKCYTKCNQNIFKAKIPEGSCDPPTPSDGATQTCIGKAETKAAAAIDKACFTAPATPPACYDGSAFRPNSGAGWVALVETVIDGQIPVIACGSPNGAFVD